MAVAVGASPALAAGTHWATATATPTARVSSTPTVEPSSPAEAEDPSGASPTPPSETSADTAPPPSPDGSASSPTDPSRSGGRGTASRDALTDRGLTQAAGFASVAARDNRFVPQTITVEVGTTVVWENEGKAPHTVTANDRAFDSGTLEPGQRFQITFDQVGTVPYYCQIHGEPGSGMTGVVRVVAAAEPPDQEGTAPVDPNELPRTGSGVVQLALLALGLAVAGTFALRAGTRRGRG